MLEEGQKSLPSFSFFPFPNINPLHLLNVPEPAIHPPGTDPYSLLNPNPHGSDRLEQLPVLDVDPRAASRSEIITKTTDLTASEHAGGCLSKITTSHSPGNPGSVIRHAVNDVIVTTFRSKNTQSISCDVCNITCNSERVLKRHKQGKKHLKNIRMLAVSSTTTKETPKLVANATLDQELEKKKHDLLQNELSVDSLYLCDNSNVGCNNQDIFTEHLDGKKHAAQVTSRLLCRDRLPNPTSTSNPLVQPSNHGTEKSQDKLHIGQSVWCEVCKVSCNSEKVLSRHISGKKHLKNLENSEKILAPPSTLIASMATTPVTKPVENSKLTKGEIVSSEEVKPAWSELLKVSCSSNMISSDISGKQHLKNLQKSEKLPGCPSTLVASVATPPSTGLVEHPKSSEGDIVTSEDGKLAWCELCKASCSINVLSRHALGKKHLKNLQESQRIPGILTPIASVAIPMENPKSTKGEVLNSEEDKLAWCEKSEKMPNLTSAPIVLVATPPSTEPVETPESTKDKVVNSDKGKLAWCELCKVSCSSNILSKHLLGKKHRTNLKKSGKISGLTSTHIASAATPPTGPVESPKLTKAEVVNSKDGKSVWCELCGIGCVTNGELNKHVSGKKHQKNMKKSEKFVGPSPATAAESEITRKLQDPMDTEGEAVIPVSHKRKEKSSLTSNEDRHTKRQKMIKEETASGSLTCTLCNVVCSSPMVFTSHLAGSEHTAMALKQVKAGWNGEV